MRALVLVGLLLGASAHADPPAERAGPHPAASALATTVSGPFVQVEGTRFVVGGRPFAFVGANVNALQGEQVRARFRETLAALAADGLTVARIWAFAEGPTDASDWHRRHHLFRAGPDGYIEDAYRHLDAVVAEAGRLGIRLVVTLSNNWGDYGGIPQYLKWAGLPPGSGPDDPAREAFYTDERVRTLFKDGVAHLLDRVNTVNGVRYVDDPTIFSWELMNESSVAGPAGAAGRRAWIGEMARFIRARDPRHLIAAGIGGYTNRDERGDWIAVHRMPEIGYCDSHLYLEQEPRVTSLAALRDQVDDRAQLARFVVGKPLVIGEFGFRTDLRRPWLGTRRDAWFRHLLERAIADGAGGAMAWIYQPWSGRPRDFGIYVDRGDTDDVRAVMRELASRAARVPEPSNARLGTAVGDRLLYDPLVTLRGRAAPAGRVRHETGAVTVEIDPARFHEARFERAGTSPGAELPHVYGAGYGRLTYRFEAPPLPAGALPGAVTIGARVSSEWPGFSSPAGLTEVEAGSRLDLLVDGERVGSLIAPPDDGRGAWRGITLRGEALLKRLAAPGVHTLAFALPDRPTSHGLCIYGPPARRKKAPATTPKPTGRTGPIRVRYQLL